MKNLKQIKPTPEILKESEKIEFKQIEIGKEKVIPSEHGGLIRLRVNDLRIKSDVRTYTRRSRVLNFVNSNINELKLKINVTTISMRQNPSFKLGKLPNQRLNVVMRLPTPRKLISPSKSNLQVKTVAKSDKTQPKYLLSLNSVLLKFELKIDYAVTFQRFPSLKAVSMEIKASSYCSTESKDMIALVINATDISTKIKSINEILTRASPFPAVKVFPFILRVNVSTGQKSMPTLKHAELSFSIMPLKTTLTSKRSVHPKSKIRSMTLGLVSITKNPVESGLLNLSPKTLRLKLSYATSLTRQRLPVLESGGFKAIMRVNTKPVELHEVPNISAENMKLKLSSLQTKFETHLTFQDLVESLTEAGGMDLLERILNVTKGYLPKGRSEALDKPVFVVIGEDFKDWHNIVAYILSELYREIRGEKPIPTIRELNNEDSVDSTVERFLMVNFKPWDKIEILDARDFDRSRLRSFIQKLRGRLLSGYLQGFGFFVVVTKNEYVDDVVELLSDIRGINKIVIQPEYERLSPAILKQSDEENVNRRYRKTIFAVLGIEHDEFLRAVEVRDSKIRSIVKSLSPFVPRTESEGEHYPLKVAVFSWVIGREFDRTPSKPRSSEKFIRFVKDLIDRDIVKIENPIDQSGKIIPDITYKADNETIYIEIETLIGTEDPIAKIQATLSKYLDNYVGGQIWIVLRPVSALIHYLDLKNLKRFYDVTRNDIQVQFKVIVHENNRWNLIDIDEFVKRIDITSPKADFASS